MLTLALYNGSTTNAGDTYFQNVPLQLYILTHFQVVSSSIVDAALFYSFHETGVLAREQDSPPAGSKTAAPVAWLGHLDLYSDWLGKTEAPPLIEIL